MLKNENGCPCMNAPRTRTGGNSSADIDTARPREGCSGSLVGGATDDGLSGMQNGCSGHAGGCGGTGDCRDMMPLAYVYAPDQKFCMLYSAADALAHGTLFEQLYKPMEVYGREHGKK